MRTAGRSTGGETPPPVVWRRRRVPCDDVTVSSPPPRVWAHERQTAARPSGAECAALDKGACMTQLGCVYSPRVAHGCVDAESFVRRPPHDPLTRQRWTMDWLVDRHAASVAAADARSRAVRARVMTQRRGGMLPHQTLAIEYVRGTGRDCMLYWCRGSGKSSVVHPTLVASALIGDAEALRGFHTVYAVTCDGAAALVERAKRACSPMGARAIEEALSREVSGARGPVLRVVDHTRMCDVEHVEGCAIFVDDAHCLLNADMVRPRDTDRMVRCVRRARHAAVRTPDRYRAPLVVIMTDAPLGVTDEERVLRSTRLLNLLAPEHPFFETHPDRRHRQVRDMCAYYGIRRDPNATDGRCHRVEDPRRFHTRFGQNLAGMVLCHAPLRGMYLPNVRAAVTRVLPPTDNPGAVSTVHPDLYVPLDATQRSIRRHHAVMPEDRLDAFRLCFPKGAALLSRLQRERDRGGVCGVYAGSNPHVHEALRVGFELMGYDVLPAHRVAFGDAPALRSDFEHRRVVMLHGEPDEVVERATQVINLRSLQEDGSGASVRAVVLPGDYPRRCQTALRNLACLDILVGDEGASAPSADAVVRSVVCMHSIAPRMDVRLYVTAGEGMPPATNEEWSDHTEDRPLTETLARATPRLASTREYARWHARAVHTDALRRLLHRTMCHFAVNCIASGASETCWVR